MLENKYGHLLDKYMDNNHVDYGTKQEREQTVQDRYGGLLEHAKPNNKLYDDILNVERTCKSIRQQREDEYERANIRRQERIECEKQEHENRVARNDAFVNDFLEKKEAERKVIKQKKKEEAEKADFYKNIERLANIDPHMAEVYIQALNYK
ncbi:MAG: hypothetical protein NC433_09790 [Clostridiales bacterium]|nr:hypothetical protein [Clostridiales bacterium]